jgi:hypothetical protein
MSARRKRERERERSWKKEGETHALELSGQGPLVVLVVLDEVVGRRSPSSRESPAVVHGRGRLLGVGRGSGGGDGHKGKKRDGGGEEHVVEGLWEWVEWLG